VELAVAVMERIHDQLLKTPVCGSLDCG
jgi:hypothetical protein